MVLNRYPLWKNLLLGFILFLGVIYAAPNLYGDDYAVQISQSHRVQISETTLQSLEDALKKASIPYNSIATVEHDAFIRFPNSDAQLKAKDLLKQVLGDGYRVALNLAPKTPHWLVALNAAPMRLGLDLRGGVNFLLSVDVDSVVTQRLEGEVRNLEIAFHEGKVRYSELVRQKNDVILLSFRDKENYDRGYQLLNERFHQLLVKKYGF